MRMVGAKRKETGTARRASYPDETKWVKEENDVMVPAFGDVNGFGRKI